MGAERERVDEFGKLENGLRQAGDWYRWGPYVSERQWGTVREDYSADGDAWNYLPHDQARSRAYRWGEDGLAGFCDVEQRLCLALALWNGRAPILKERAFGLPSGQGNHGEDVKEHWWYLDATVAELRRDGVRFRNDVVTGVGGKQIIAEDPSGNPVELFEPTLPEARLS